MKIVLTGGGTGGHIYPNIALLPKLKEKFNNIYYIGETDGIEEKIVKNNDIEFFGISCTKLIRSLTPKNLLIPFELMKSVKQAKQILEKIKPDIVFSKGGYVSLPVCMASKKLKIPVIVHESDYSFGLANKLSIKYAKKVLTSFPINYSNKMDFQYTGTPIRDEIIKATPLRTFSNFKPTLLVVGGSSGAQSLNELVRNEISEITKKFNVLHLCGKNKVDNNIISENYLQEEYSNNMGGLMKGADIIISRGGANALFEITQLNKPSLIIPLSNSSSRGDQVENAKFLAGKDLVMLFDPKQKLATQIDVLYENRVKFQTNLKNCKLKDGKDNIIDAILSLGK